MHKAATMNPLKKKVQLTGHNGSIFSVIADHQEGHILSGAGDGWVVRWSLAEPDMGKLVAKVETQIFSMCLLRGQNRVVVGNMNGGVHWVDLDQPDNTRNIAHHQKGVYAIRQINNDLFTGGGDGIITRWDSGSGKSLESLQLSRAAIRGMDFSPQRNEIAIGASDHAIYFLDASDLSLKRSIPNAHDNSVFCVKYSADDEYLYSGGRDAQLKVWEIDGAPKAIVQKAAHWYTINDLALSPDGDYLATGSRDKTIRIWRTSDFKLVKALEVVRDQGHINSVNSLLWLPGGALISASDDRRLIVWEADS